MKNKLARSKAYEILGKHCPNGLDHDGVIDAITEGLEQFPPASKGESSTNSNPGSSHWFNTIMGEHLRTGEFLKDKVPDKETIQKWGQNLFNTSKEVIDWFEGLGKEVPFISPYECKYFDEAQGKNYCSSDRILTKKCVGAKCGHFTQK